MAEALLFESGGFTLMLLVLRRLIARRYNEVIRSSTRRTTTRTIGCVKPKQSPQEECLDAHSSSQNRAPFSSGKDEAKRLISSLHRDPPGREGTISLFV